MASSRAIKKKRDDTALTNYQPMPERAPSVVREEPPTIARIVAMVGLFLSVLGVLAMLAPRWQRTAAITEEKEGKATWGEKVELPPPTADEVMIRQFAERKKLKVFDSDHFVPRNGMIKEILGWLDRYLGPVETRG